jgi:GNAT superfamily N-acetyltransferase
VIRKCGSDDFEEMFSIVNDAAQAYKGVIPADCWKEPYMDREELWSQIGQGVKFWGYEQEGKLAGIMGLQAVKDIVLIRHAYVRTQYRNQGIGTALLSFLLKKTRRPVLVGTWKDASWAVRFYEKRGFVLCGQKEKDALLKKYWSIPDRQVEASVVLTNKKG